MIKRPVKIIPFARISSIANVDGSAIELSELRDEINRLPAHSDDRRFLIQVMEGGDCPTSKFEIWSIPEIFEELTSDYDESNWIDGWRDHIEKPGMAINAAGLRLLGEVMPIPGFHI